jgi:murein DD-endopeptidase MepM/ murein hydrolase activator NlpD
LDRKATKVTVNLCARVFDLEKIKKNCWAGPFAVDVRQKPGSYAVKAIADGRQVASARIKVVPRDYGIRRITVNKKFSKLTSAQLARYKREIAQIKAAIKDYSGNRLWRGGFVKPVDTKVVSRFGKRSIVNGIEKSPHGGVDLRGKTGDPVKAPAQGRINLVLDTYFGGLMVMIDHGQGLVSCYLHLSAALVEPGQIVEQGEIIGEVGSSGRVTGPHLHWGLYLSGAKLSPLDWINTSKTLSRFYGEADAKN